MRSFLTLSDSQNYKYQSTFSTPGCELGKSIDFVVSSAMEWLRRPEHFVALFHYHTTQDQARAVLSYHLVKPEASEPLNFGEQWPTAVTPHVTLTSIPPEAGREKIAEAIGSEPGAINYGVELLLPIGRLNSQYAEHRQAIQIFAEEAIWVWPMRIWSMDEVERRLKNGDEIHRFRWKNDLPYAEWRKTAAAQQRPHHGHGFYGKISSFG